MPVMYLGCESAQCGWHVLTDLFPAGVGSWWEALSDDHPWRVAQAGEATVGCAGSRLSLILMRNAWSCALGVRALLEQVVSLATALMWRDGDAAGTTAGLCASCCLPSHLTDRSLLQRRSLTLKEEKSCLSTASAGTESPQLCSETGSGWCLQTTVAAGSEHQRLAGKPGGSRACLDFCSVLPAQHT